MVEDAYHFFITICAASVSGGMEVIMNYLENYLNYYTGENRKQIFKIFFDFINCLRTNDYDTMKTLLSDDCIADISMTGHFEGAGQVCEGLSWPGPKMDVQRITFSSFVCRTHDCEARQCAYTQHLYALEDEKNVFPFTFGGEFNNSYRKINGQWKISHIRYDLMYEDGNNSYVKDKWKLMDYGVFYGHTPMINEELDAPWFAIPIDDEPQSDAEQIFEVEFKNNIGQDGNVFHLSQSIYTDDIALDFSNHKNVNKNYSVKSDSNYYGRKAAANFFKAKSHKEARLQHIASMVELKINGNTARAYMMRSEYHRIKNNIYNKKTIHEHPVVALHQIDFVKEKNQWKMKRMSYYPIMEFLPIGDDCICFDDYICGDQFWQPIKKQLHLN